MKNIGKKGGRQREAEEHGEWVASQGLSLTQPWEDHSYSTIPKLFLLEYISKGEHE